MLSGVPVAARTGGPGPPRGAWAADGTTGRRGRQRSRGDATATDGRTAAGVAGDRAGEEAGEYLGGVYAQARALAQGFSVPVEALPGRVAALSAERDARKAEAAALRLRGRG